MTITVVADNHPPVAVSDTASVHQGEAVTIPVLANDSDPDGDAFSITANTSSSHGTVTRSGNNVVYTAASNYTGPDTFTYTISDGRGGSAKATVSITVTDYTHESSHFTTFTQGGWGAAPSGGNPGRLLADNFSGVYAAGYVKIGGTKYLKFTSASAITAFLPAGGTAGKLTATKTNPTTATGGVFAGQVLAL